MSTASGMAVVSHGQGLWPEDDAGEGWRQHMCEESMVRWAAWSVGSIQSGPEVGLELSTPAVPPRQGLTSPG